LLELDEQAVKVANKRIEQTNESTSFVCRFMREVIPAR